VETGDIRGLTQLNTELLQQNTELRIQRDSLKAKLQMFQNSIESDSSEPTTTPRSAIKSEIGKILNPKKFSMLPVLRASKMYDHATQTDHMDCFDVSQEAKLSLIEQERDQYKQSYDLEKQINHELNVSLEQLRSDAQQLEEQFTKLSNDAEIALASERLANDTVHKHLKTIQEQKQRIVKLEADLEEMTCRYGKVERDYEILSRTVTTAEEVRKHMQPRIDPVIYLESEWAKDRTKYYTETEHLKAQLESAMMRNQLLKSELESKVSGMPQPTEYAETLAKLSLSQDEVKRLSNELRSSQSQIVTLEAQLEKLRTIQSSTLTRMKNAQFQVSLMKKDTERKENMIKEHTSDLETMRREIERLQAKVKLDTNNTHSKDLIIRDYKSKIRLLESLTEDRKQDEVVLLSLQNNLKVQKLELNRKNDLVKHWKERFMKLEKVSETNKELQDANRSKLDSVDKRVVANLELTAKNSKDTIKKLNQKLQQLMRRDEQFSNVVERLASMMSTAQVHDPPPLISGLDADKVDEMAQNLAKTLLDVDWSDLVKTTTSFDCSKDVKDMYCQLTQTERRIL
jgi:chromosome segregation ATPase